MEVVLDTCAVVWSVAKPTRLSEDARKVIGDAGNDFVISSISIWEIALKVKRGTIDRHHSP